MLFNNWNISGCVKFRMLDNKTSSFDVEGDIPEGWSWQLLYSCNGNLNIVEMQHGENILSVIFTKEMLPTDGTYLFQLKATKDDLVKHTNIVKSYVNKSLSGDIKWPVIPTEFTQIEQAVKGYAESAKKSSIKAENAAVHSPIVGENGNWFIWDFEKSEYVDSGKPASIGGGTDLSLGLTAATVGQTVKVKAVDADGKPTAWEAVDAAGGETWEKIADIDFDVDAANNVFVWEYKNLPNYKELSYKKVGLVGSTETASGLSISINDSEYNYSSIQYAKNGGQSNGWGKILLLPFGWIHVNSGSANLPTNYSFGGLQVIYNAIPFDGDSITSVMLSSHSTYKIAGGKLSLYGRR